MDNTEKIKILVQVLARIVKEDRFYTFEEIQCGIADFLGFTEEWLDQTMTNEFKWPPKSSYEQKLR
jgi:hypothetical protein